MQAIARVNRVFRDKPGGLVVDYLGLAHELKQALATYTESGGTGETALDQEHAVAAMLEKYEVCCGLFHGFDRTAWVAGTPAEQLGLLPAAQEHVLAQENGKERCLTAVRALSQAFALAVPHAEALRIRDDVGFFQAVRAALAKHAAPAGRTDEELDHAVAADRLAGGGPRRRAGHLRRRRSRQAGRLHPLGRVPGRGARHAAPQPRRRAAAEAPGGRAGHASPQEPGRGALVRRHAGADHPPLPEPRRRGRPGHRGADRHRPRAARSRRPRRGPRPSPTTSSPSTTPSASTTAPCRSSATRPSAASPASWSPPSAATSPSTGPCARTSAPTSAASSSASSASTATRPTSRRQPPGPVLEQAEVLSAGWGGVIQGSGASFSRALTFPFSRIVTFHSAAP